MSQIFLNLRGRQSSALTQGKFSILLEMGISFQGHLPHEASLEIILGGPVTFLNYC